MPDVLDREQDVAKDREQFALDTRRFANVGEGLLEAQANDETVVPRGTAADFTDENLVVGERDLDFRSDRHRPVGHQSHAVHRDVIEQGGRHRLTVAEHDDFDELLGFESGLRSAFHTDLIGEGGIGMSGLFQAEEEPGQKTERARDQDLSEFP